MNKHNGNISPVTFIDKLVKKNELGQLFRLSDHQREILRLAFAFDDDDRLPWDTIVYSCVKKSGKTTLKDSFEAIKPTDQHKVRRGIHQGRTNCLGSSRLRLT